jgi:hypothetical protein
VNHSSGPEVTSAEKHVRLLRGTAIVLGFVYVEVVLGDSLILVGLESGATVSSQEDHSNHSLGGSLFSPQDYTYNPHQSDGGVFGSVHPSKRCKSRSEEWPFVVKVVSPTTAALGETEAPTPTIALYCNFIGSECQRNVVCSH